MNLQIEYVSLDSIKPYDGNAKLHPQEQIDQIKRSIKLMGFDDPIAIWKNGEIIEGHGRYLAAKQLGMDTVPIIRLDDLTDEQRRAYALIHNKLTMNSGFDTEILNVELAHIGEIDMESFDFQIEPLDFDNLGSLEDGDDSSIPSEVVEDDYEEELPEEPTAKHGDIFLLGRHRLMCGDSTKIEDVKRLVDGAEIDILVTDPPYNVEYEGKTKDRLTIKNDSMEDSAFRRFLRDAFSSADAVLKPGGVFYIWHADSEGYNFRGACKDIDWQVRQCLIWVKSVLVMGRQDYQWKHEPCQPAGTMVWTPTGKVPIEQLKDGDRVVSFDTFSGTVKGYKEGLEIKTASRFYSGNLYSITVGSKTTRATDNHKFSVRFNSDTSEVYCTYLMRKGNRWRVGITRTYDARGFGLKHRVDQEKADAAWLIQTFKSMGDAQVGEQLLACKYGIPYTHWEVERGLKNNGNHRTSEQIEWLYEQLDGAEMQRNAERLLSDYGRSIRFPLIDSETKPGRFSRRVTAKIHACNIIPDLMQVPIPKENYDGMDTFSWEKIDAVQFGQYEGMVYSLAVDKYEHYVADGIVTHNCLYGWKSGAGHFWASDRKQTTTLNFDKPVRSEIHPTMKPIALFDYLIKNSSKVGENVLDLFNGSGTTIMACEQNGRNAFCMELDPRYVDAAVNRWEQFTGKKAVLLNPEYST